MRDYTNFERCNGEPCCVFAERICADNYKELLEKEVSCLKAIAQNQSDLISDVFHSPVYRSYVNDYHTIMKKDGYGNSQQENLPYHQIVEQRVEATHHHDVLPGHNNPNVGKTSQDKV